MLSKKDYFTVLSLSQIVSVDLLIYNTRKQILLGKRKNRPAKDFLFVPGGKIFKNERIFDGASRVCNWETGLSLDKSRFEFFCVNDHIYPDNFSTINSNDKELIGTHYVCIGVRVFLTEQEEKQIDFKRFSEQHSSVLWLMENEIIGNENVHNYTKDYFISNVYTKTDK